MQKYSDITFFYNTLIHCSISERAIMASKIKNNVDSLKNLIGDLSNMKENEESKIVFLFIFEFAVHYIRIPFIIFFHDKMSIEIFKKSLVSYNNYEKNLFLSILEKIFEMFILLDSNQINVSCIQKFIILYMDFYKIDFEIYLKKRIKTKQTILQTLFEKHFNITRRLINAFTQQIEWASKGKFEEYPLLFDLVTNIQINFEICKDSCEKFILKSLQNEKHKLLEQINNFLDKSSEKIKIEYSEIITISDQSSSPELNSPKKEKNDINDTDEIEIIWIRNVEHRISNQKILKKIDLNSSKTKYEKLINDINNLPQDKITIFNDAANGSTGKQFEQNVDNEKMNNIEVFEKNALNKIKKNIVKKFSQLEDYPNFEYKSNLPFLENLEIEFKNYSFPFQFCHIFKLKKTICAFLNTDGGRIYLGIRDEDQCVLGIDMNELKMVKFNSSIKNILELITPPVQSEECIISYMPVIHRIEKKIIKDLYVIKIIVKRGKLNDLYFTNDRLSYKRRNGKNSLLSPPEFKAEILKRANLDENECQIENNNYNKKFSEIENYLFHMKNGVKNSLKRNYNNAFAKKK